MVAVVGAVGRNEHVFAVDSEVDISQTLILEAVGVKKLGGSTPCEVELRHETIAAVIDHIQDVGIEGVELKATLGVETGSDVE